MASFDDLQEHRQRLKFGLILSPLVGLACWFWFLNARIGDPLQWDLWSQTSTWFSLSPFVLGSFMAVYSFFPYPQGRFGSASQGDRPRPWREGNPAIRQPSSAGSWVMFLMFASFLGCASMWATDETSNRLVEAGMPLMYVSLTLIYFLVMAQAHWLELDIDSLRIIRHRVIRGLQLSEVQPEQQSIRALGVCRGSFGGPYRIYAFAHNGVAIPLSQDNHDLSQVQFEAERLSDQLMVPLLGGMENQASESVARHLRSLTDEKLPVRQDWAPVKVPDGVLANRSIYPPID
ncbi:hypothetical protein JST97_08105 [bacterium]|nr:hypothetical protein [bacterium]